MLLVVGDVRLDGLLLLYECSTTSTRRTASAATELAALSASCLSAVSAAAAVHKERLYASEYSE